MTYRTLTEKLASALTSDDLRLRESACDLDKIIGSGWASKRGIGGLAFHAKYLGDKPKTRQLAETLESVAVARARQKRSLAPRHELQRLARGVLAYWLDDKCPVCQGRGMMVLGQTTSDILCHECAGSGMRRFPSGAEMQLDWPDQQFVRRFTDLQNILDSAVSGYLAAVRHSLKHGEMVTPQRLAATVNDESD